MTLDESYLWCGQVARSRARNFYPSFLLLDKQRRRSMCAIYAFMRICDDLSDGPGVHSHQAFAQWRADLDRALDGSFSGHRVWPAFADTVNRYRIPAQYFHHMIDGVQSDLDFQPVQTFDDLYRYCYRVASVVGMTVVHVLGFTSPDALPLAEKCGVAFQLTNILRDVKEDFDAGRVYLPADDLLQFGVERHHLAASSVSEPLRNLLQFEARRANQLYYESSPLLGMVRPEGRAMLAAIIEIYSSLLRRIEESGFEVLRERIAISGVRKAWILARHALG